MTVNSEDDLIDLVAEMFRIQLLKAMVERPGQEEREAISDEFSRDTVGLIAAYMYGENNADTRTLN